MVTQSVNPAAPSIDSAIRIFIPNILDSAGLPEIALRLRTTAPNRDSYLRACELLRRSTADYAGPWLSVLKAASFWASCAMVSIIAGNEAEANRRISRLYTECSRGVTNTIN